MGIVMKYCVYIGPSVRGVMNFGAVLPGNRTEVLKKNPVFEAHPDMKPLVVSGEMLPAALREVKTEGTALHALARKVRNQ